MGLPCPLRSNRRPTRRLPMPGGSSVIRSHGTIFLVRTADVPHHASRDSSDPRPPWISVGARQCRRDQADRHGYAFHTRLSRLFCRAHLRHSRLPSHVRVACGAEYGHRQHRRRGSARPYYRRRERLAHVADRERDQEHRRGPYLRKPRSGHAGCGRSLQRDGRLDACRCHRVDGLCAHPSVARFSRAQSCRRHPARTAYPLLRSRYPHHARHHSVARHRKPVLLLARFHCGFPLRRRMEPANTDPCRSGRLDRGLRRGARLLGHDLHQCDRDVRGAACGALLGHLSR